MLEITISLSALLIVYGIFLLFFVIFAFVNLYHLIAYGFLSFESYFMTFIFLAGTILILFITYKYGIEINWDKTFFELSNSLSL